MRRIAPRLIPVGAFLTVALWVILTPAGIIGKAGAVGYAICHQILARTFLIGLPGAEAMPLCARCTGIYLGVLVGFAFAGMRGRGRAARLPHLPLLIVLGSFVALMGIDGVNSYIQLFPDVTGVYTPANPLRLITGMLCGLAVSSVLLPLFNRSVWEMPDQRRILDGWRDLLALCALGAAVVALILSERPLIRLILGFLSVGTVVFVLILIGCVLFLNLSRHPLARGWRELALPLSAGVFLAFLQLGGMAALRFALTGTWGGFVIG
ncbi:MAG TPA: DUF2085 domain-containing protein [Aggregatilineales bacterium]|nr:DUF2085 domain-containing protein [Anaerolineales bacterium]HRE46791.1 DUF2085 domain-containing protein [Aggregatilineales bacterium]